MSVIELSTEKEEDLHILGYGFGLNDIESCNYEIGNFLFKCMIMLEKRCIEMFPRIEQMEDKRNKLSRMSLAKTAINAGYFENLNHALKEINYESLQCTPPQKLTTKKAIKLIRSAGGISVLAHPRKLEKKGIDLEILLEEQISYDLECLECFYPLNSVRQKIYIKIAKEKELFISRK